MTYASIRDAIVDALETVPNIGTIHNYQRYVQTAEHAAEAYNVDAEPGVPMVRFADVEWTGATITPQTWGTATQMRMSGMSNFVIRLYRSLEDADASGREFAETLEAAMLAITRSLENYTPLPQARIAVVLTSNAHVTMAHPGLGHVLVHRGEITVSPQDTRLV